MTIAATDSAWADHPNIGFNDRWIVVQVNMILRKKVDRSHIYVFDKADLLAGGTGKFTLLPLVGMGGSQVPAIGSSSTGAMYLLQNWSGNSNGKGHLRLYTITGTVGSEVLTPGSFVSTINTWDSSPPAGFGAPQLAPMISLETPSTPLPKGPATVVTPPPPPPPPINLGDAKIRNNVECRAGSPPEGGDYLFAVHTGFLPAGGRPNRSAVQFWEVRTGGIFEIARIDDPTGATFYAYPSVAITHPTKSALIGFSSFSASQYPSANWAIRWYTDPADTIRMGGVLKSGEGPYHREDLDGRNRWGDYSSTCLDPKTTEASMIWTLQEYSLPPQGIGNDSGRWGTWWGKFALYDLFPPGPSG